MRHLPVDPKLNRILGAISALVLAATAAAQPVGSVKVPHAVVSNLPPVQMLVPGFSVRELPLELNNINNFVYAPDGRLFALCYDGNVLQLKDTDGDGLEDTATHFYKNDRNEITTCIDMAWGPGGLYIPAKGRIVRIRDQGDGTGVLETVTGGWRMRANATRDFDSYGIAIDRDGTIYFGLCTENMRNAYLINTNAAESTFGQAGYTLKDERGSILKVPPGSTNWQQIATGFRYTTALEFNEHGDLFALDQEGATWLPNGNPLDELLHVLPGRHYGFPPRHPKHLPDVIDEPSVYDYGPQHQSTCDLHFNLPVGGSDKIFGPPWWRGDAIVTGESRGKLYRTKLVKTPAGYVAQNQIIGSVHMLTVEAAPTPEGDLLLALHSGRPDWGTGPQGKGKLYKISHTSKSTPLPVLAYAQSPTQTRIVFDRPIEASRMANLAKQAVITMGLYVSAGDQFESFYPGYQAVRNQRRAPRFRLPVLSAAIGSDLRSLVLRTAPRTEAVNYAVTIPDLRGELKARPEDKPQHAVTDLLADLTGVEATLRNAAGSVQWSGWLPHLDLTVARALTAASAEHAGLFRLMTNGTTLTLRAQLDLYYMLRAKTQPDSKLDFTYPPEKVTVAFRSNGKLQLKSPATTPSRDQSAAELTVASENPGRWIPIELTFTVGSDNPSLDVSWLTHEDPRPRALPLRRIYQSWVTPTADTPPLLVKRDIPEIAGGDWVRGKAVFFNEQTACFKCHQMHGEGGTVGPDLSNLIYRDYASVYRDVVEPNAALDPDYLAYTVVTKTNDVQTGVLLNNSSESVQLGQATGNALRIPIDQVVSMQASTISLMPTGLLDGLTDQQRRDLFTFLLLPQPGK